MDKRPKLNKNITLKDFRDFYWIKEELVIFCRKIGINSSGGKIKIANRIVKYLKTGKIEKKKRGFTTEAEDNLFANKSDVELIFLLKSDNLKKRTSSAIILGQKKSEKAISALCE